ncbi:MAG: RagB/SusD family nutrient uptake outer membrane protein, partial [Bacteroidetes bacterium]|nr:RagB/SusD family nutrient uptake outer membrane protein [Bacteroidota bacterium]
MTVFGTDEYLNGNADATYANYTANLNPANSVTTGIWNSLYAGINTCNAVIDAAPSITGMDEKLKSNRLGETRFLRAHYYFLLLEQFGALHITLKPTSDASNAATRSPIADVYKVIIDDLTFAIANLNPTTPDYGRATIPAAKHMLAKVYLTRAGSTAKQTSDYDNAASIAKDVIQTGGYKLLDDFSDLFAQPSRPNAETMLACQYSANVQSSPGNASNPGGGANAACFDFCASYEGYPGMQRDLANGRPFAHFRPTTYMLSLYNKTVDTRFDKTFKTVWLCNKPGTYTVNNKSVTFKAGDTALVMLDHEITTAERNAIRYTVLTPSQYSTAAWPMNQKFQDSLRATVNNSIGVKDVPIYRLGETYLIAAEALLMSNKPDEAVTYINTLRKRSAKPGATPAETAANQLAMQVAASDLNLDFILDERARELSGEFLRFTDLTRTG